MLDKTVVYYVGRSNRNYELTVNGCEDYLLTSEMWCHVVW